MRIVFPLALGAAILVALAFAQSRHDSPAARTHTASPTAAADERLIVVDPKELVLREDEMIPGSFTLKEGSIATAQWNRSWDRDPADPGAATGVTRVAINARLFRSLADATKEFTLEAVGANGVVTVKNAIKVRGFYERNIRVIPADVGALGADDQSAWRGEFTRGNAEETYVQYFVFVRVRNARALVTAFAQNRNGAEAPNLLADTKQVARQQAAHLVAIPPR